MTETDLLTSGCRYCATLSYFSWDPTALVERSFIPEADAPTATATFVRIEGKLYAFTAQHVVRQFTEHAKSKGQLEPLYVVPTGKGVSLSAPFVQVPQGFNGFRKDIAMMPLSDQHLERIGKHALDISDGSVPAFPLPSASAFGFPTAEKKDVAGHLGTHLAMQCVQAIAVGVTTYQDADQVQFFSEIERMPNVASLSGMSGGPVFWSDEDASGLLGFVHEALDVTPKQGEDTIANGPRINFICHRASFEDLTAWAKFIDREWPKARATLNARVPKPLTDNDDGSPI